MRDYSGHYLSERGGALYHYGIEGMKWGQRRFQNYDGSYTQAGRERYGIGNGEHKDAPKEKTFLETLPKDPLKRKLLLNNFQTDNVDLSKIKTIEDLTPKHDKNSNNAALFVAKLAMDTLVPGYQVYLPFDNYRGGQAINSHIKTKKYEKEREANPIDPKTGFHLKTENLSEKEDLKRVNPSVNDFNSNSKSNCVLCTMTCEMRRRGYDVTANKAGQGYWDREINNFFPKYKVQKYEAPDVKNGKFKAYMGANKDFGKSIVEQIEKSQPEGSRGNLTVDWGGGGAHSMFYEIKNGKMVVYDGQIAKIYDDPVKILKNATTARIGRLDNLAFSNEGIKECCR